MRMHRSTPWKLSLLALLVSVGVVLAMPGAAYAVVGTSAAKNVPYVQVSGTGDSYARASTVVGDTVYVGGALSKVYEPATGTNFTRHDLYGYSASTNRVTSFAPNFNGPIWGLAASPDGRYLYAAGNFSSVNGVALGPDADGARRQLHLRGRSDPLAHHPAGSRNELRHRE
jgi:hypothetical protein